MRRAFALIISCKLNLKAQTSKPIGLVTATKTNILGTTNMLWSVNYYDGLGRVIQAYKQHNQGGGATLNAGNYDVMTNTYDFTNALLTTNRAHYNAAVSTTAPAVTIANSYTYDHMGRKRQTQESINGGINVVVSQADYNEIGQLLTKHLHSENSGTAFLQHVPYTYNETYKSQNTTQLISRSELLKEINDLNSRIAKARESLLNGDIDGADYKTIKSDNEYKINVLEAKLAEAAAVNSKAENIEPILRTAITKLTRLNAIYSKSTTYEKRELIGSMYPQKFTFEELQHRTAQTSKLYSCIYLINSKLKRKKEGQATDFSCLPILAPQTGLEPVK